MSTLHRSSPFLYLGQSFFVHLASSFSDTPQEMAAVVVILDVAQGYMNEAPNEIRTHS